ncbi:hypothetical protein ACFQZZ_09165 [Nocardia sp. GCM10030253]|uniref:hypothetical protein n=1 Tax=Nocardia sp. GCM10030253 TaxID=3273404 RepID=UPI00362ED984
MRRDTPVLAPWEAQNAHPNAESADDPAANLDTWGTGAERAARLAAEGALR